MDAMATKVLPDVELHWRDVWLGGAVTALLTPRDEEALNAHLRGIENAGHLQTLTIPQLRQIGRVHV